jgi:alkyl hydroperoxide reductase subunit F
MSTGGGPPGLDPSRLYDALVLGAGPAGICAAIYLVRKGLATGVVAKNLGGQVAWTSDIENYPGFRLIDGTTLVQRFREQVAEFSPHVGLDREVSAVERRADRFVVGAGGVEYAARALVVATGKRPRLLGVPGEQRLLGRGVATCAICDAPLFRGKSVAVVGGGNSGLDAALDLVKLGARVTIFQDLDRLTGTTSSSAVSAPRRRSSATGTWSPRPRRGSGARGADPLRHGGTRGCRRRGRLVEIGPFRTASRCADLRR